MNIATRRLLASCVLALLVASAAAKEPCDGFVWDVKSERALFAIAGEDVIAGAALSSAPSIRAATMYTIALTPQSDVQFALPPGKKMLTDGAYAGLVRLRVASAGVYRVSLDEGLWIDLVSGQQLLPTVDFQGSAGCNAPRKIVEFSLPANADLVLQLSAATHARVRVSLTQTATPAP